MAASNKIDSNITGLRYAEEETLGNLPTSGAVWNALEPNGYADFGGQITTVARNPINPSRQRKKGVVTDLEASGGFGTDLTQEGLQDLMQGFMFADARRKNEISPTATLANSYTVAAGGGGYVAGDLLFAKQFTDNGANGLKNVTGTPTATNVTITETIPVLTGQAGTISHVGFQFASGDAQLDVSGTLPQLTATTKDLTTLGLIPGEWVFIGGDTAVTQFDEGANEVNNGFARIRSVTTNAITFDKTVGTMSTQAAAAKTIQLFFGRVIKNELGTLIKCRSYQLERTLGAPDSAQPNQLQAEYVVGAVPNELSLNLPSASKIEMDLSFIGTKVEQRLAGGGAQNGPKAGTRPALVESEAFNTSSDFSRIKLAVVNPSNPAPTPLFAFSEEITLTLNNNISPNKALGVLGSFAVTIGTFEVGGSLTSYFADLAATQSVNNNDDITLDVMIVKNNQGITLDLPLISLGDGRPTVEQDQPIKLPLTMDAATAAKIDPTLDYTMMMVFWDYLPNAADT